MTKKENLRRDLGRVVAQLTKAYSQAEDLADDFAWDQPEHKAKEYTKLAEAYAEAEAYAASAKAYAQAMSEAYARWAKAYAHSEAEARIEAQLKELGVRVDV